MRSFEGHEGTSKHASSKHSTRCVDSSTAINLFPGNTATSFKVEELPQKYKQHLTIFNCIIKVHIYLAGCAIASHVQQINKRVSISRVLAQLINHVEALRLTHLSKQLRIVNS